MTTFNPSTGEVKGAFKVPYKCRSWRHEGDCRRWRAAQNFSRVSAALAPLRPRDVVMMVFTLNPAQWKDRYEAFAELTLCWSALRKAITREYGRNDWVGTVEVHRSGWPHLNVVMFCPTLADQVGGKDFRLARAWLKRHAVACGFGYMLSVERARDKRAVAGYVVKVAGEVDKPARADASGRLVGEVVKLSQLPEEAPAHFRRLRSSIGFLPKPFKSEGVTGTLKRSPLPPPKPKT
jgi:hypothetical protein